MVELVVVETVVLSTKGFKVVLKELVWFLISVVVEYFIVVDEGVLDFVVNVVFSDVEEISSVVEAFALVEESVNNDSIVAFVSEISSSKSSIVVIVGQSFSSLPNGQFECPSHSSPL